MAGADSHSHTHDHHHQDDGAPCAHARARLESVDEAMAAAESVCVERGVRLTPIRRAVLEALYRSHAPMGAYELLERLNEQEPDVQERQRRARAPIAVYRALDFLMEQGFAHKLASRNAFTACPHGHAPHDLVAFLICEECGGVDELSTRPLADAIGAMLTRERFAPRPQVLEITGTCAHCRGEP